MTTLLLVTALFLTSAVVYARAYSRWGFGIRAELTAMGATLIMLFILTLALGAAPQ